MQQRLFAATPISDREVDELNRVALEDTDDAYVALPTTVLLLRFIVV